MDETHRFLRYVMPGALFFIEALLLLLVLLSPGCTFTRLGELVAKAGLGGALGALVALLSFGVLGFFFSIIHHLSLNRENEVVFRLLYGVDNKPVIARLRKRSVLQLLDADKDIEVKNEPSRHEAWTIVNALWHQHVPERINRRAETLADRVHAIGTARVGALFAGLIVLVSFGVGCYVYEVPLKNYIWRLILMFVVGCIIFSVHELAYRRISSTAESLIAEILEDTLTESFWDSGRPVRTFVALQERRKRDCLDSL